MDQINYEQLAQTVKERREAAPETLDVSHREAISDVLREQYGGAHTARVSDEAPRAPKAEESENNLPDYAHEATSGAKQQVELLVAYTLEHGLSAGISKAMSADPYILDLYHDTLADKLHDELKNRKLL